MSVKGIFCGAISWLISSCCLIAEETVQLTWVQHGSELELSWAGSSDMTSTLQSSVNLESWTSIQSFNGSGETITYSIESDAPVLFYRVQQAQLRNTTQPLFDATRDNYPRTNGEIDPSAEQRLEDVLLEIQESLAAGSSLDDVTRWLEALPDLVDLERSAFSIVFRLQDNPPSFVHDGLRARSPDIIKNNVARVQRLPRDEPVANFESYGPDKPVGQMIVGRDRDADTHRDYYKRLFSLAPFAKHFGEHDSQLAITSTLVGNQEYWHGGRLIFKDADVTLGHYLDWNDFDFIHLSTHGMLVERDEEDGERKTWQALIASVDQPGSPALMKQLADDPRLDKEGIAVGLVTVPGVTTSVFATALTPGWFTRQANTALEQSVIFLDACRSMKFLDFSALCGLNSVIVGWNENVGVGHSKRVLDEILTEAVDFARPINLSVNHACAGFACEDSSKVASAKPVIYRQGADLRLIEIVSFIDRSTGGKIREPSGMLKGATIYCPDVLKALLEINVSPETAHSFMNPLIELRGLEKEDIERPFGAGLATIASTKYRFHMALNRSLVGEELLLAEPLMNATGESLTYRSVDTGLRLPLGKALNYGEVVDLVFAVRMPDAMDEQGKPIKSFSYAMPVKPVPVDCCGEECEDRAGNQ